MNWRYHWRTHPGIEQLTKTIEQLRAANVQLRHDLTNKTGYAAKLELWFPLFAKVEFACKRD
jgi:hypothetical protein